jgi:glycosyltransferase involved in cell wall biosynthesis
MKLSWKQPFVSVLIPAYNEEKVIGRLLQRLTELTYSKDKFEVIVINDNSKDATGRIAESHALMHPNLIRVINRNIGGNGKAEALNVGLRFAIGEIICCFDADYVHKGIFWRKWFHIFLIRVLVRFKAEFLF